MSTVVQFLKERSRPAENPNGSVVVYPCPLNGGSWAVEHVNGAATTFSGAYLGLDDAVAVAREWAAALAADFPEGLAI